MNRRRSRRRRSTVRALGTALAVALIGVLPVLAGRHAGPRVEQPVGSQLPGPGATAPPSPARPDVAPSGEHVSPPASDPAPSSPPASTPTSRVIYLTFDDGPDPTWTPQVLAALRQFGAKATFFELGAQVHEHPAVSRLVRSQGHRIGNHTYAHRSLPTLDDAQLRREIERGPSAACLRPPFGDVDARVRAAAARAGQTIVLWDVDTRDWAQPGTPRIVRAVMQHVHPGATILMHDAGGDRSQTVDALHILLPKLVAQGYTFSTVPGC